MGHRRWDEEEDEERRIYRSAKRAVNRRIGFMFHLIPYLITCFFMLLLAGPRVAMIIALGWGIGVASHWFAIVAPTLREHWIDRELDRHHRRNPGRRPKMGYGDDVEDPRVREELERLEASLARGR